MSLADIAGRADISAPKPRKVVNRAPAILLGPSLIFYTLMLALPFCGLVAAGFMTRSDSGLFEPIFTVSNYWAVFTQSYYLKAAWVTLRMSVVTSALCLLLAYPVAYWLAGTTMRMRKAILIVLMFPLLLSTIVRVYGWIVILGRRGLINQTLIDWGVIERPLNLMYTEWTVVLGLVSILIPYAIINITNTLLTIDPAYREAAAIHSASPWKVFTKVTLPLSKPGIVSAGLIVFSISMSTYLISLLLGGPRVKLLGNIVFDSISSFNWPQGAALSVVLVMLTLVTCSAFSRMLSIDHQKR